MRSQKSEKPEAAEQPYQQALRLAPNQIDTLKNYAVFLTSQQQYQAAIKVLKKAVALQPSCWESRNNLGIVYAEQKKFESAIKCFRDALKRAPDNCEILFHLGKTLEASNQHRDAIITFRKVLLKHPNHPGAALRLASLAAAIGDLEYAYEIFQSLYQSDQKNTASLFGMGSIRLQQKKVGSAVSYFELLVELEPDHLQSRLNLIGLYASQLRNDEAEEQVEQALKYHPENATLWSYRGHFSKQKKTNQKDAQ